MNNKCHDCESKDTVIVKIPMCKGCLVDFLNDYTYADSADISAMNVFHGEDDECCDFHIKEICKQVGIEIEAISKAEVYQKQCEAAQIMLNNIYKGEIIGETAYNVINQALQSMRDMCKSESEEDKE